METGELILGVKFGGFGLVDFYQWLNWLYHRGECLPSDDRRFQLYFGITTEIQDCRLDMSL